jgi:hypothetical protein
MKIGKRRRVTMIKYSVKLQKTKIQINFELTLKVIMMMKTFWAWAQMNRKYKWLISLILKQIQTKPPIKQNKLTMIFYNQMSFFNREHKSIHSKFLRRGMILSLCKVLLLKKNFHCPFSCKSLNLKEDLKISQNIKSFGINMKTM